MERKRTMAINVRVTENEKKKLERLAKCCGLSLSAYLRQVGLGKDVKSAPSQDMHEVYRLVSEARANIGDPEILTAALDKALGIILDITRR